ncbi:DUF2208 family protein [Candidatus Pacearchaeota archaeon]|nr:DUF2208 family protein [Candidatus Pacearchaeota archaeon]
MALIDMIQGNPRVAIIFFSFLVTLFITVITYYMTDREKMKAIRDRQKLLRKEMKQYRDNPQKMMELNKQLMADFPEQMKHSMKPMLVTIIPLLILFSWLRSTFAQTAIAGSWFWWYLVSSIIFSMFLRKSLGLQ